MVAEKRGSIVTTPHSPQYLVAAALQGNMEVGAKATVLPQFQQFRPYFLGLQRGDPQPGNIGVFQDGPQQASQPRAGNVEAVGAQLGAGEGYFQVAFGHPLTDLADQHFRRNAALPAPHLGHDAVGAYLVAAFLNLHHGPGCGPRGTGATPP